MPREPPVTSAVLPSSFFDMVMLFLGFFRIQPAASRRQRRAALGNSGSRSCGLGMALDDRCHSRREFYPLSLVLERLCNLGIMPSRYDLPQDGTCAVELRHLRYFVAIAETGSLTFAAEKRLNTAQP